MTVHLHSAQFSLLCVVFCKQGHDIIPTTIENPAVHDYCLSFWSFPKICTTHHSTSRLRFQLHNSIKNNAVLTTSLAVQIQHQTKHYKFNQPRRSSSSSEENMKLIPTLLAITTPFAAAFAPNSGLQTSTRVSTELYNARIEFVKGLEEKVVPDVKLTRARDGSSGTATFSFKNPNCFDASTAEAGEVTGMFLIDEEGELSSTDVNASFTNGKPQSIEARYVMNDPTQWDRFMRFMERYGEANGLGFTSAK